MVGAVESGLGEAEKQRAATKRKALLAQEGVAKKRNCMWLLPGEGDEDDDGEGDEPARAAAKAAPPASAAASAARAAPAGRPAQPAASAAAAHAGPVPAAAGAAAAAEAAPALPAAAAHLSPAQKAAAAAAVGAINLKVRAICLLLIGRGRSAAMTAGVCVTRALRGCDAPPSAGPGAGVCERGRA